MEALFTGSRRRSGARPGVYRPDPLENGAGSRYAPWRRSRGAGATLLLLSMLCLSSCARPRPLGTIPSLPPLTLEDEIWVHRTLSEMSLEQRVGQMLMVQVDGEFENARAASMRDLQRLLTETHVGALTVSGGTPLAVAAKLNELQRLAPYPLLVASSRSAGAGAGLLAAEDGRAGGDATIFPYNMGLAATVDASVAELAGRITGMEARALGIHWLLGPVADIHAAGDRSEVGVRSFGSDAATVGAYVTAFIQGASTAGVLTTALHFPGTGAAEWNGATGIPVLSRDSASLENEELRPFRAAIFAGVPAIMVGHAAVPSMTGYEAMPASLSRVLTAQFLRGRLHYNGLILTAPLDMPALREQVPGYSPGELAIRAVEAGADVLVLPPDPPLAHRSIVAAVRAGRLHYARIDSSVVRVLRAKARLGLHERRTVPLDSVARIVRAPEHDIVATDIAERALTLARDSSGVIPLDPRRVRTVSIIAVAPEDHLDAGAAFADEMTALYGRGVTFTRVHERSSFAVYDSAGARAQRAEATILAMFTPPGTLGDDELSNVARAVAARARRESLRMITVSFGDPYLPAALPGSSTYLLAWQPFGEAAQRAAARGIAGRNAIPGRLPVELSRAVAHGIDRPASAYGLASAAPDEVGMDALALARVDSIISAGIINGAAPGAALAVGRHGRLVRLRGYGTIDRRRGYGAVTDSTIYDLASLTKVVATTSALMMLVEEGRVRLDDTVAHFLPEWRGVPVKRGITIRDLLLHDAGLPAYAPLWRELSGRDAYRRRILSMSLDYPPRTRTVYSDLGIILLGMIVEQVSGAPLDVFVRDRMFRPLGMRDSGFNPLQWAYASLDLDGSADMARLLPDPLITRIAPTEVDTIFRRRHIHGEVHDENAWALGGVAGHAGLFSSARDLAIFAQMMLDGGFYGGRRYLDPETIGLFTRRQLMNSSRALGWDTPESGGSAGRYFTESSFGHTGFTGTSIWIDPERDVFVVLLTNRVNPTRNNQRHLQLRRDVADAVQRAIIDMPVTPRIDPIRDTPTVDGMPQPRGPK